jgi:DNA-binding Xre family transcriptional regulator
MLYINLKRTMHLRGIENHYKTLTKLGIVPSTARAMLDGNTAQIKLDQLEHICLALNCTPNDLLEWQPDSDNTVAESHSLQALRRKPEQDLTKLLREIPMERFEQIIDVLQDLKDK